MINPDEAKKLDDFLVWARNFKTKRKDVKRAVLNNPLIFLSPEFQETVRQEKLLASHVDRKSTFRKIFMIQEDIYRIDPDFWDNQMKNKKQFRLKYPYFYVGE
jgi:hypothetical protein